MIPGSDMTSTTTNRLLLSLLATVSAAGLWAIPQSPAGEEADGELVNVTILVGGMLKSRSGAT